MLKQVRAWRGRLRATMGDAFESLTSLLLYNDKHPAQQLLTTQQKTDFQAATADLLALLEAKRLR
jgi:hypothetical protein